MKTMQIVSLLFCFALFFLLPHHPAAASPDGFRASETAPAEAAQDDAFTALPAETRAVADIHDIYGPVPLPEPPPYLLYGLVALIFSAICLVLFLLYRFRQKRRRPVQIDPAAKALKRLADARSAHKKTGDIAAYCDEVSAALRSYIEQQTGYRISSLTTLESVRELERRQCSGYADKERLDLLRRCFTRCDMVKFARFTPEPGEAEGLGRLAASCIAGNTAMSGGAN